MPGECAATGLALGHDDFDTVSRQHIDRGGVDIGIEHALGTAGQQGDACAAGADGGIDCVPKFACFGNDSLATGPTSRESIWAYMAGKRFRQLSRDCREPKSTGIRQRQLRDGATKRSAKGRRRVGSDQCAKRTDQIAIRNTRRTSGLASQDIPGRDRCAAVPFRSATSLPGLLSSTRSARAANRLLGPVPCRSDRRPDRIRSAHTC